MPPAVHSVEDMRRIARRRLPAMVFDFLEGGALDEFTLRRNRAAFADHTLQQRVLVDIAKRSTRANVLGDDLEVPMLVSPMGLLTLLHPSADVAIARAAADAGSIFVHSPWSGCTLEEVVNAAPGRVWSQIAFWKNPAETERHLREAARLGIKTIVVAGDVAISSKRDRDLRHGTGMPPNPPLRDIVNTALHPGWLLRLITGRRLTYASYQIDGRPMRASEMKGWMAQNENQSATWEDLASLRRRWDGNLVVKGIMTPADADLAITHGADAVFVSNHGGRQFDDQAATIDVLPAIVETVNGRAAIIADSGIRRGSDILKTLALGADAAAGGRPFALGLAALGPEGPARTFEILRAELSTALGFVGASSLAELSTDVIRSDTRHLALKEVVQ